MDVQLKKNLWLVFLALIAVIFAGEAFVKHKIASEVRKGLSEAATSHIHVSSIRVHLLSSIVLHHVQIQDPLVPSENIIDAKQIKIAYNPLRLFRTQDPLELIHTVTMTRARITVRHLADDRFNFLYLLKPSNPSSNRTSQIKNMKVQFNKCQVDYIDRRGFGIEPLPAEEHNHLMDLNGQIMIGQEKTQLSLLGNLNKKKSPLRIGGFVAPSTFSVHIASKQSDMTDAVNYFMHVKAMKALKAVSKVDVFIRPKTMEHDKDIGLRFDVMANVKDIQFQTSWVKPILTIHEGWVQVNNQGVFFKDVHGQASGVPFTLKGDIQDFNKLNLTVTNPKMKASYAQDFLPFLKNWNLDGQGAFELNIKSQPDKDVELISKVTNYTGHVFQYQVQNGELLARKISDDVTLEIPRFTAYSGKGSGSGWAKLLADKPTLLNVNVSVNEASLHDYFDSPHFLGHADIDVHIGHEATDLLGEASIKGRGATMFGQRFDRGVIHFEKTADNLLFLPGSSIQINEAHEPIYFEGNLDSKTHFNIGLKGTNQQSDNLYFFYTQVGQYDAKFNVLGHFQGLYNDQFRLNPLLHTTGEANVIVDALTVTGNAKPLVGAGRIRVDQFVYLDFDLAANGSQMNIAAKTTNKALVNSRFKGKQFPLSYAKPFVRSPGFDYDGLFNGNVLLFPDNNHTLIKNFGLVGTVDVRQAVIASTDIDQFIGQVNLHNNLLHVENGNVSQKVSDITFDLDYQTTRNFSVHLYHSRFKSSEWPQVPSAVRVSLRSIEGFFSKQGDNVEADLDVDTDYMFQRDVQLPNLKGRLGMGHGQVFFNALNINYKNDSYLISGNITTDFLQGKLPHYDLFVKFGSSHLENLFSLYQQLKPLWKKDSLPKTRLTETGRMDSLADYANLISKNYVNLYSIQGKSVLDVLDSLKVKVAQEALEDMPKIEGTLKGYAHVSDKDKFTFFSDLTIENARIIQTQIQKLRLLAELKDQDIQLMIRGEKMMLMDNLLDELRFEAKYNPDNRRLNIQNLYTSMEGLTYDHILKGTVNLAPIFDGVDELPDDIDLTLTLDKDNINVISFVNASLKHISNEGDVVFGITGPLRHPVINSKVFQLRDFEVQFRPTFPVKSPLRVKQADLVMSQNKISIPVSELLWKGEDTNGVENKFQVTGSVALDISLKNIDSLPMSFDLTVAPTQLDINFADLYVGKANADETKIEGTLFIPLTRKTKDAMRKDIVEEKEHGPLIKTAVTLNDGRFIILTNRPAVIDKPPFKIEAPVTLGKDLFITGMNMDSGVNNFLNTIYIELDEVPGQVNVKGSFNTLDLEHRFQLKTGKLVFMNQVFNLLEKPMQRELFRNNPESIADNTVEIRMMPDPVYPTKRKATPFFNLKAYANIKQDVSVTNNLTNQVTTQTQDHLFVIYVNGFLNTPQTFIVEHYLNENGTYQLVGDRIQLDKMTSEQLDTLTTYLLPVLLRPQFYQSLMSKGLGNNKEANEMLRDFSASQINLWIDQQLRPIGKEVAKATGLYDVRIQHKIGEELMNAVPVFNGGIDPNAATTQTNSTIQDNSKVSAEFIKDLFVKKLFVKLKTGLNQDPVSKTLSFRLTEYELMWFLNDFISVNYANHNLQNSDTIYGAFSINANFDF